MKIGINGFGRIGRAIFKICLDRRLNVVAINDVHGSEAAAYALKYDSIYGKYGRKVSSQEGYLIVDGKKIKVLNEKEPYRLPWADLGVDVVIESTGVFTDAREAMKHISAGAKKVIITAPARNPDCTIVPGVNDSVLNRNTKIISVGSCTTNCTAVTAKVLLDNFGIKYVMLTTIHAYTNDQVILDSEHHSIRRGRAAGLNMIPTTTGAAEAVVAAIPELKGKMTGLSVRVPVACGSLIDLTCEVLKKTNVNEVNATLENASKKSFKGFIEYSTDPLVSSDIVGNPHSAIIDAPSTQVDGNLVKVLAWYDNEFGYSNRVVDVIQMLR
ncbi:MAG: type I glyceraldehyde-3-phosphate dehydrogenase [Nanoarchaeota archaeon]